MLRINPITNLNCNKPKFQPAFASVDTVTTQDNVELPNVQPDYNVKTPMPYQKVGEKKLPFDYNAYFYKLSNGQRIVIVPKKGETVVKTFVGTGSMNEPDNLRGISHYIEHNLFNGSNGLAPGEFFETVNKMGGETNASTSFATTDYYVLSNLLNAGDLENKIKIHASMLESPRFAIDMLEKEKGIVNSEINMILGNPINIITNETLRKLYNIKSTSSDLIGGNTQNITNLTRQDVIDYYNNNYYPANMVTVVTGEVNPDETIKLLSKYFSGQNKISHARKFEDLKPIEKTVRQDIISDKTTATEILLGFNGPKNNDVKELVCSDAITELLTTYKTGRLNKILKPYNTNACMLSEKISSRSNDPKAILIGVSTTEANSEKVLKKLFEGINSIITNPPSDEEMQIIKKSLLNSYTNIFECSASLNSVIGDCMLFDNLEVLINYKDIINSITKEDIVNAAKKYLDLNKTAVTVLHPQTATESSINQNYKNSLSFTGKQAVNPENVERYIFNNNYELVTNDSKTDRSVFEIIYNTESQFDVSPAVVHILRGILQEGSLKRDDYELSKELNKNGIILDFNISEDAIYIVSISSVDDMEKAFECAKEVLASPRFTQETFDFVKQNIKENLSKLDKSVEDKLYKEFYGTHYLGATKEDILKDIDNVTLDEVKRFYQDILNKTQGHVVVSAPFSKKSGLKEKVFEQINTLPKVQTAMPFLKNIYKPVTETKVLTDTYDKSQAEIAEAFKFKINDNLKDSVTVRLLNTILGGNASSRLFNDLREKQQLAYRVNSSINFYEDIGVFKLFISTTTDNKQTKEQNFDNVKKSINGFNKHIKKLMSEKVTQEELDNAKLYLKNLVLSGTETTVGQNDSLASGIVDLNGALIDNEVLKTIDTITVDDIYNAANYIFGSKPTYSILATEDTINANKEFFDSLVSAA